MPSSPNYKRNYREEYDRYQGTPEQRKKNDSRKKARRLMEKLGKVKKGDGKDVDHKNGNPLQSHKGNLRVTSKTSNRSFPRNAKAGKK
jgi:hypothetical protein